MIMAVKNNVILHGQFSDSKENMGSNFKAKLCALQRNYPTLLLPNTCRSRLLVVQMSGRLHCNVNRVILVCSFWQMKNISCILTIERCKIVIHSIIKCWDVLVSDMTILLTINRSQTLKVCPSNGQAWKIIADSKTDQTLHVTADFYLPFLFYMVSTKFGQFSKNQVRIFFPVVLSQI